jgi:hypothetical protein
MGAVDEVLDLEDIGFDPTFPEAIMLIATSLLAHAWGRNLVETYRRIYGDQEPQIAAALDEAARLVIERFASSDVRCIMIANTPRWLRLCVQDILRGRRLERMSLRAIGDIPFSPLWPTTSVCALDMPRRHGRAIRNGRSVQYGDTPAGSLRCPF